jgi:hypothetical protein
MAKYFYDLVVSVLDEDGNRVDAHEDFGSNNKKEVLKRRTQLKKEIKAGKYNKYANFEDGETLCAEIEVHDDKTYELLWIE